MNELEVLDKILIEASESAVMIFTNNTNIDIRIYNRGIIFDSSKGKREIYIIEKMIKEN